MNVQLTKRDVGRLLACIQKSIVWYEMEVGAAVHYIDGRPLPGARRTVLRSKREIERLEQLQSKLRAEVLSESCIHSSTRRRR